MAIPKRTVLITGCSDGGLGAALAIALHEAGLHVYATARTPSKMAHLTSLGIETMTLDVLSNPSITACVSQISSLDILINNAGAGYTMPVSDISIPDAKKLFDLNVWSYLAVTQAFLPLLLKSKGMIVNQTSTASVATVPFASAYGASKAAMAMFSTSQRLELAPFGITVIELKTGIVRSNFITNHQKQSKLPSHLPENSIYSPARAIVEKALTQDEFTDKGMRAEEWAKGVARDILKGKTPIVWRGEEAFLARIASCLPFGWFDGLVRKITGLDLVEQIIKARG